MRRFRHIVCWLMAFAVPVSLSAAEVNPAMLSGFGDVKINGSAALRSSTVYAGDRIATGENSSVTVSLKGTVIAAPSHSSVIYRGAEVKLEYGSVVVNTKSATNGHLGSLTITPEGGGAKFELMETKEVAMVAALQGSVNVTDGVNSVAVLPGQMLTRAALNSTDLSSTDSPISGTSNEQASARKRKRGIPGWVIGTGVAAAAGGVLGALAGSSPTSPSKP
jgi:hypothetical protein